MSRKLLFILPLFLLSACANTQAKEDIDWDFNGDDYTESIPATKDGIIFHAFCWKYSDITANLPSIAEQAFKSIQISPVQQPKSGGASWWSFYQPLSFSIATNSPLGTKEELRTLCTEAEKYHISIIADVVLNHMANIDEEHLEQDDTPTIYPGVEEYEPYLYQHRNDSGETATFHHNMNAQGSGAVTQKYSFPGSKLPDLNTANPYVQERALSLLKECIDVGIDGFRLDAAKHIETPTDPQYASDYFPNVTEAAKQYYKGKTGEDLYIYGEILGDPEGGRSIDAYLPYMDVTDNGYRTNFVNGANLKDASYVTRASYSKECSTDNLVVWTESHDDYCNGESIPSSMQVNKTWAMLMGTSEAKGLYFARPASRESIGVATIGSYLFEEPSVGAANRFFNRFKDANTHVSASDAIYVSEKYSEDDNGAVVVNLSTKSDESNTITAKFSKIPNGVYFDQMTGEKVLVKNHKATINLHSSRVAVLTRTNNKARPYFKISNHGQTFLGELAINFELTNGTGSYQINEQNPVNFSGKVNLTLTSLMAVNEKIVLKVNYGNEQFANYSREYTFSTISLIEGYFNVVGMNPSYFTDYEIYLWSWGGAAGGHWSKDYIIQDGRLLINLTTFTDTQFLIGLFAKGYVISNISAWDNNCLKQTSDISISSQFFDASNF